VPFSDARNFPGQFEDGEAWDKEQSKVTEIGRIALVVNLLTEDNLPSYHHEIASLFGRDGAWGTWVHRWTAEEGRHGIVMRDYLLASRAVDPDKLEAFRMQHMSEGFESDNRHSMLHSVAYVAFQELATRISHRNTGHQSGDPVCDRMLAPFSTFTRPARRDLKAGSDESSGLLDGIRSMLRALLARGESPVKAGLHFPYWPLEGPGRRG